MIDIQTLRGPILALHHLPSADGLFTFYYDETNNIRRLLLTPDGMNVRRPDSFVLGGILHSGAPHQIDLKPLRDVLRIQPTVTELKLKHLGKGDFLNLLSSPKLETFLRWISEEGFLIHYQVEGFSNPPRAGKRNSDIGSNHSAVDLIAGDWAAGQTSS